MVGSGAGGAVAATTLAEAGCDTLLLEGGPHHDATTFDQTEAGMLARLYEEDGQRFTRDQSILILSGRGLGGSTVHNTALCVPPPAPLLDTWDASGALAGGRAAFDGAVSETMQRIGAAPPEAHLVNRSNALLREGAERLGLSCEQPLTSRVSCSGCGYCILGCAYNRKRNVLYSHLEGGVTAGLRIVTEAPVTRIRRRGSRSMELRGPGLLVRCAHVIVACSALGTPVLLQRSGLGGRGVGRSLRLHPFAPLAGVFADPVDAHRGIPQSVLVTGGEHGRPAGEGGWVLMGGAAGPAGTAALLRAPGDLAARAMRRWRHLAVAGVLLHDRTRGRVRARRDGLPSVSYWPGTEDVEDFLAGVRTLASVFLAAGAESVLLPFVRLPEIRSEAELDALEPALFRPHDVVLTSVHPQGSVPMGRDRRSPVDPSGRLRAAPRVRVADASLFPGSVGVPPQVTIMAQATGVARDLLQELSGP